MQGPESGGKLTPLPPTRTAARSRRCPANVIPNRQQTEVSRPRISDGGSPTKVRSQGAKVLNLSRIPTRRAKVVARIIDEAANIGPHVYENSVIDLCD